MSVPVGKETLLWPTSSSSGQTVQSAPNCTTHCSMRATACWIHIAAGRRLPDADRAGGGLGGRAQCRRLCHSLAVHLPTGVSSRRTSVPSSQTGLTAHWGGSTCRGFSESLDPNWVAGHSSGMLSAVRGWFAPPLRPTGYRLAPPDSVDWVELSRVSVYSSVSGFDHPRISNTPP